jgi:sulfide:quinone oxidoreductase
MAARGIEYTKRHRVYGIDPADKVAHFKHHDEPYDLFIGIPVHKVPDVLVKAGLTENGWVNVDPFTLATPFPGVYALGDCAETGIPKAGVFAESAARAVADEIAVSIRGGRARRYDGTGLCFVEMGDGEVGRVDVYFRAEGGPTAPLLGPSTEYAAEKADFGAIRRARWFDL